MAGWFIVWRKGGGQEGERKKKAGQCKVGQGGHRANDGWVGNGQGNEVGGCQTLHQDSPNLSARFLFFSSISSMLLLAVGAVVVVVLVGFEVGPVIWPNLCFLLRSLSSSSNFESVLDTTVPNLCARFFSRSMSSAVTGVDAIFAEGLLKFVVTVPNLAALAAFFVII